MARRQPINSRENQYSSGMRAPQHDDLLSPVTRRLAKLTIVFLMAVIVLAVIIVIAAMAARSAVDEHQPLPARSINTQ
jgi:cell division protein FtsL